MNRPQAESPVEDEFMQINSDILRYIKRRLVENATDEQIKAEIRQAFGEITEDAIADGYIEVAKQDAPRLMRSRG